MTNLTTALTAQNIAKQSEAEAIRNVKVAAGPGFGQQTNLPVLQKELLRSSLAAHLNKAQSDEINISTQHQLKLMQADINLHYQRKKIQVTILDHSKQPVEAVSIDKRTGRQYHGHLTARRVTGVFHEAYLFENVLVLTPTTTTRLVLPSRKYILVYVANPETLLPLVDLRVLN